MTTTREMDCSEHSPRMYFFSARATNFAQTSDHAISEFLVDDAHSGTPCASQCITHSHPFAPYLHNNTIVTNRMRRTAGHDAVVA